MLPGGRRKSKDKGACSPSSEADEEDQYPQGVSGAVVTSQEHPEGRRRGLGSLSFGPKTPLGANVLAIQQ